MRRARLKSNLIPDYPDDVRRIVQIAADHGVDLNEAEAQAAWRIRSEEWSASWLVLDRTDERIWNELLEYGIDVEDEA